MFPYRVAGKHDFRAYGTFTLIVVMFLAFAWEINFAVRMGSEIQPFFRFYAFVPCQVGMQGLDQTLLDGVRSLFLHMSFTQLLTNAVFLWIFGPAVESYFRILFWTSEVRVVLLHRRFRRMVLHGAV
jgi:membrane associated rhomboid family serine protease